jgi:hypothetical protein
MSLRFKASALALFALAATPFAGCGGSSNPNAATCSGYCQALLACVDPSRCVLRDPAATHDACVQSCEAGYAGLTPAESDLVTACFSCQVQATGGKCLTDLPGNMCTSACFGTRPRLAQEKFLPGAAADATGPSSQCTNGMNAFGLGSCSTTGDATSCTESCCNAPSCTTPDVAVQCTMSSPAMCTCTAGKNTGKRFSSAQACSDVWTACNQ